MTDTLLSPFETLPYFTIQAFRQVAGEAISGDDHARVALSRWVKAGRILRLKKGVYMHRRFYERHHQDPAFSAVVSAILLPQSYLSLEYVLQKWGILTEITYPVTSVTPKNTRTLINAVGTFVYRHIKPELYRGFQIAEAYGVPYAQATLAKALFDYFYLRPIPAELSRLQTSLTEELRLNLDNFSLQDREAFAKFVHASGKPKMRRVLANLEKHVWLR